VLRLARARRSDRSAQERNSTVGPISEKTLVFLECKEAFENMCPVNTSFSCGAGAADVERRNAGPVNCKSWFDKIYSLCPHYLPDFVPMLWPVPQESKHRQPGVELPSS
jgi:hypothetical protein